MIAQQTKVRFDKLSDRFLSLPKDDPNETAYSFGLEDANRGEDARGSAYYGPGGSLWRAYNQGYCDGYRGDPAAVAWMRAPSMICGFPDITDGDIDAIFGLGPEGAPDDGRMTEVEERAGNYGFDMWPMANPDNLEGFALAGYTEAEKLYEAERVAEIEYFAALNEVVR